MTALFNWRERAISFFCTPTNSASPISTPKSPRATMITSDARIISSIASSVATVSARSTLATIRGLKPASLASFRAYSISAPFLGNDTARYSTPISAAVLISALSLSVRAGAVRPPPLRLIPLLFESGPATVTSVNTFEPSTDSTFN